MNAIPVMAWPPNLPINIISTRLYSVCIPIPNMIGIAKDHRALEGFSKNTFKRELDSD